MTLFAGRDVSVRETSVCVVDDTGKVLAERKVATEPDDLFELLRSISSEYGRIGLEAGPLDEDADLRDRPQGVSGRRQGQLGVVSGHWAWPRQAAGRPFPCLPTIVTR